MASQSLYRRYRPRRFAEIKGQDHVVRALRDSVAGGREGQAYLFSGPRGTGKTTSARILAKVLNCEQPVDGEPCCECPSCLDVERGASYDVHELDAASNNGVDAMRDLIDKAQLGTPGRHKVYILDEVHMLSKPAEAALLKTLEEPPDHVVFVLATTDPQKVSDTIRSRTQHLRFHLLPPDVLADHVRWVASDAGLDLGDDAIASAVGQGAGSARDALSALELIANSGGNLGDQLRFDDVVEALIEHDPGQALTAVAHLVNAGHDPRTVAEELVRHLRNGFLSLMAPELVQSPSTTVEALAAQAQRLGAAALVAAIERLGDILVELRHAPDPRVLIEVALVQLTRAGANDPDDGSGLAARVAKLENAVAAGAGTTPRTSATPVDPTTGRAKLGGRAQRAAADADAARPDPAPVGAADADAHGHPASVAAPTPTPNPIPASAAHSETAAASSPVGLTVDAASKLWTGEIRPALKGLVRALFAPVELVGIDGDTITLAVPNATHRDKCDGNLADVQQRWAAATGAPVRIAWSLQPGDGTGPVRRPDRPANDASSSGPADPERDRPREPEMNDADEIDESRPALAGGRSALDRIAEVFPGAERVESEG